jgi:hypothetical protein
MEEDGQVFVAVLHVGSKVITAKAPVVIPAVNNRADDSHLHAAAATLEIEV